MAFYWSARSLPELRHLPAEARKRVVWRAIELMALQPSVVEALLVLVFMFGAGIFGIILGIALMVFAGLNAHWVTALVAIPLAWLVWPFMINLVRPRMRKIVNFLESKEDPSEEKKELG